jgi:hypothetical protein
MAEDIRAMPSVSGRGNVVSGELNIGYGPYKRFPSNRQRVAEYMLMALHEPTVIRVLAVVNSLLIGKLGQYYHENEDLQEQVNDWLNRLPGGMPALVQDMLSSLWAGFAVLEPIWDTTGSEWTYQRIDLLHPLTFFKSQFTFGGATDGIAIDPSTKRVERLTQFPVKLAEQPVTFAVDDVIYWPFNQRLREQVYGNSILAGARRAWFSKTQEENFWNTFAQKCAMPTPVFSVPNTTMTHPETKENVSLAHWLMEQYEKLEPGMALAIPGDPDTPVNVSTISPVGNGEAFERVCEYWKSELFNAMLVPRMVMEEPEHGSRAQANSVLDLFYNLMDGIRRELGTVLVSQVVSPLLRYNAGDFNDPGEWQFESLEKDDLELLAGVYESVQRGRATAIASGVPVQEADERKTREVFGDVLAGPDDVVFEQAQPPEPGGVERYA